MSTPTHSKSKVGFRSAIVTAIYLEKISLKEDIILERMLLLGIKKMNVVIISDEIVNDYTNEFNKDSSSIKIEYINLIYFFSLENLDRLFSNKKGENYNTIYYIHNKNWSEVCMYFISACIDISGGSNNKKHLLSIHQFRLSQFLMCIYGNETSSLINQSFHSEIKHKKGLAIDKKKDQKVIIDFLESNDEFRSRLLASKKNNKKYEKESDQNNDDTINYELNQNKINCSIKKFHTSAYQLNNKNNNQSLNLLTQTGHLKDISIPPVFPDLNNKIIKKSNIEEYLESVKNIISEVAHNSDNEIKRREAQEKFENSWIDLIKENLKDDNFFINKYQSKLFSTISEAARTLNIYNENKLLVKQFPQLGSELNKTEFLILTFSICISLYNRLNYNALAIKVGEDIIYYNYKNYYINKNKPINNKIDKIVSFEDYKQLLNINKIFYIKLGDFFITILQRYPHDLFVRKITEDSYYSKEPFKLEMNKEYLDEIKNNLILNPTTLPMICKPNEWTKDTYGGYLSNKIKHNDIITSTGELSHKTENKDSIYKAVNYLNTIKFSVNNLLLDYLLSSEGSYILEHIKPEDELQRKLTLFVAQFFKNICFYLNTHTDWRGRIYTQSFYLSYQAGDLSSALLNFAEGETITEIGKVYLYIYGANSHNENDISKCSYADRIKWVKENYDKIINLDKDLILSADSPFIFTSFCLNMKEIHKNPNAEIKTPVFLDGTCSGIQHLAALMKDLELGGDTNLLPSKRENKPNDIYTVLLEHINKKINQYGFQNPEFGILSLVNLTRKEIKSSIMTKVYNVTIYGISQQLQSIFKKINDSNNNNENTIKDDFDKEFHTNPINKLNDKLIESIKSNKSKNKFICNGHDGKKVELSKKDIYKIATIINDEIFVKFPALNKIYNYFMEVTDITSKLGISLSWITPSGLKITQEYLKTKQKIITISIFGKSKKLVIRENESKINSVKQKQAIIPNIVHSLDASHLINLINEASNIKFYPIITIHDCFGTLPNKMSELDYMVRKEFILIYSNGSFLKDFHNRFIQNITDNQYKLNDNGNSVIIDNNNCLMLPTVPELGELDIEDIKNSKYMIS